MSKNQSKYLLDAYERYKGQLDFRYRNNLEIYKNTIAEQRRQELTHYQKTGYRPDPHDYYHIVPPEYPQPTLDTFMAFLAEEEL